MQTCSTCKGSGRVLPQECPVKPVKCDPCGGTGEVPLPVCAAYLKSGNNIFTRCPARSALREAAKDAYRLEGHLYAQGQTTLAHDAGVLAAYPESDPPRNRDLILRDYFAVTSQLGWWKPHDEARYADARAALDRLLGDAVQPLFIDSIF